MISLENISFSYGSRKVLDGISFSANDGEFVAVLGANGAGKSTLVRIASGALRADSGKVKINGYPPKPFKSLSNEDRQTLFNEVYKQYEEYKQDPQVFY